MNKSSSNTSMQDPDELFRLVNNVDVPAQLYEKLLVRISVNSEFYIPGRFVRFAAAVLILMIAAETFVIFSHINKRKDNVSLLVELPDNSLNYE